MILRTTRAGLGPVFASRIIRPSLSHAVRPPAWRTYSVKAPNPGRQAPAASGAQGAQMSASSKHPFDTGEPRIPRGALKDPAAGPNSRPADMEPSLTQSPSAGPSAPSPQSSGSSVRTSTGATTSTPGSATTAASAQAQTQASIPETRDPVRGPSSSPASDLRDPVRGPSSSPVPSTPTVEIPPSPAEGVPSEATEMEETVMNPRSRHPFDTYAFVSRLERSGIDSGTARALMEGVRSLIVQRSEEARRRMLSREELDNAAYRFKAALSELRTEQSVRTRNDGIALRSAASAMRREVDGLEQQMKVDLQGLRHDIDLDLNNRKTETQAELKAFEIAKEEINNKFTISLGDLRTDIESAKWDATRRAIGIIAMLVITGIALSTFSIPAKPPPAAPAATRDIGVGTDDKLVDDHDHHDEHHDEHHVRVEEHLDAILQDRGWRERERERERTETPRERIRREKETATTREVDRDTLSRLLSGSSSGLSDTLISSGCLV